MQAVWLEVQEPLFKGMKFWLAGIAIGVIGFLSIEIVPVYMKNFELDQATRTEARFSVTNVRTAAVIHDEIYNKAQKLGLPVQSDDIEVHAQAKAGSVASLGAIMDSDAAAGLTALGIVDIDVSYAVPVPMPGFTWNLHFHIHADDNSA
jgi:hypothetical protein